MRALGGGRYEGRRLDAGLCAVMIADRGRDGRCLVGTHQGNGATAEAAAGHPRADHAVVLAQIPGRVDQGVEFHAAHFVVVAQGIVAGVHELADCVPVVVGDFLGGLDGTFNLADYVASAAILHVVEFRFVGFEQCKIGFA